jgi:hypothetical protein
VTEEKKIPKGPEVYRKKKIKINKFSTDATHGPQKAGK